MPIGPTNRPAEPRLQPGQGLAPQRPSGRPGGARSESSQPTPVSGRNTDDRVEQTPSDVQGTDKPITLGGDTREKLKQAAQAKRSNPIKGQLATGPLSRNHDEFRVANVTPNTGASGASGASFMVSGHGTVHNAHGDVADKIIAQNRQRNGPTAQNDATTIELQVGEDKRNYHGNLSTSAIKNYLSSPEALNSSVDRVGVTENGQFYEIKEGAHIDHSQYLAVIDRDGNFKFVNDVPQGSNRNSDQAHSSPSSQPSSYDDGNGRDSDNDSVSSWSSDTSTSTQSSSESRDTLDSAAKIDKLEDAVKALKNEIRALRAKEDNDSGPPLPPILTDEPDSEALKEALKAILPTLIMQLGQINQNMSQNILDIWSRSNRNISERQEQISRNLR